MKHTYLKSFIHFVAQFQVYFCFEVYCFHKLNKNLRRLDVMSYIKAMDLQIVYINGADIDNSDRSVEHTTLSTRDIRSIEQYIGGVAWVYIITIS